MKKLTVIFVFMLFLLLVARVFGAPKIYYVSQKPGWYLDSLEKGSVLVEYNVPVYVNDCTNTSVLEYTYGVSVSDGAYLLSGTGYEFGDEFSPVEAHEVVFYINHVSYLGDDIWVYLYDTSGNTLTIGIDDGTSLTMDNGTSTTTASINTFGNHTWTIRYLQDGMEFVAEFYLDGSFMADIRVPSNVLEKIRVYVNTKIYVYEYHIAQPLQKTINLDTVWNGTHLMVPSLLDDRPLIITQTVEITGNETLAPHIYAWYFDGEDDYIEFPGIINDNTTAFDYAVEVKANYMHGDTDWDDIVDEMESWRVEGDVGPDEWVITIVLTDGTTKYYDLKGKVPIGEEHTLRAEVYYDGVQTTVTKYIDGELASTKSYSEYPKSSDTDKVRFGWGEGNFVKGTLSYLKIESPRNMVISLIDPTFYNGTHYINIMNESVVGTPHGGVQRVPDDSWWLWVVKNANSDGKVHFRYFPEGYIIIKDSDGKVVKTVKIDGDDVAIPLPAGEYTFVYIGQGEGTTPSYTIARFDKAVLNTTASEYWLDEVYLETQRVAEVVLAEYLKLNFVDEEISGDVSKYEYLLYIGEWENFTGVEYFYVVDPPDYVRLNFTRSGSGVWAVREFYLGDFDNGDSVGLCLGDTSNIISGLVKIVDYTGEYRSGEAVLEVKRGGCYITRRVVPASFSIDCKPVVGRDYTVAICQHGVCRVLGGVLFTILDSDVTIYVGPQPPRESNMWENVSLSYELLNDSLLVLYYDKGGENSTVNVVASGSGGIVFNDTRRGYDLVFAIPFNDTISVNVTVLHPDFGSIFEKRTFGHSEIPGNFSEVEELFSVFGNPLSVYGVNTTMLFALLSITFIALLFSLRWIGLGFIITGLMVAFYAAIGWLPVSSLWIELFIAMGFLVSLVRKK